MYLGILVLKIYMLKIIPDDTKILEVLDDLECIVICHSGSFAVANKS